MNSMRIILSQARLAAELDEHVVRLTVGRQAMIVGTVLQCPSLLVRTTCYEQELAILRPLEFNSCKMA